MSLGRGTGAGSEAQSPWGPQAAPSGGGHGRAGLLACLPPTRVAVGASLEFWWGLGTEGAGAPGTCHQISPRHPWPVNQGSSKVPTCPAWAVGSGKGGWFLPWTRAAYPRGWCPGSRLCGHSEGPPPLGVPGEPATSPSSVWNGASLNPAFLWQQQVSEGLRSPVREWALSHTQQATTQDRGMHPTKSQSVPPSGCSHPMLGASPLTGLSPLGRGSGSSLDLTGGHAGS